MGTERDGGPTPLGAAGLMTALEGVDRAAGDLRRGLPVVIEAPDGPWLVLAAESARADRLAALEAAAGSAGLAVYLSHARAKTLKIRLYTADAVAVALKADEPVAHVHHLADPTRDLGHPLAGPYRARRGALPAGTRAALALLKRASLLPAFVAPLKAEASQGQAGAAAGLARVRTEAILAYDAQSVASLERLVAAEVPLAGAKQTRLVAFRAGGSDHLAIVVGEPDLKGAVLVRLHSECLTGDLLGSLKCDCGDQLRGAIDRMAAEGAGILLYLAQEGRGIGLLNKLRAYALQDQGFDTVEANERLGFSPDERDFTIAAAMLKALGVQSVRLLTNNPTKLAALTAAGLPVVERVPLVIPANEHNRRYLETKAAKSGHQL